MHYRILGLSLGVMTDGECSSCEREGGGGLSISSRGRRLSISSIGGGGGCL